MIDIEEIRKIWNTNAEFWDDRVGDGNLFQDALIEPASTKLLGDIAGKRVLDIACGAGRYARKMAEMGAYVLGIDLCDKFIERAGMRTPESMKNIEYRQLDATDASLLKGLGRESFDAAVCTMGLMDMRDIDPLFSSLPHLLKPGGIFVFTIMHPCFQNAESTAFAEETEFDGRTEVRSGVKVSRYIEPVHWKGVGVPGQPERHYYFHRPLSLIFGTAFRSGLVVDGLEEPVLPEPQKNVNPISWSAKREIPPILAVRMRKN